MNVYLLRGGQMHDGDGRTTNVALETDDDGRTHYGRRMGNGRMDGLEGRRKGRMANSQGMSQNVVQRQGANGINTWCITEATTKWQRPRAKAKFVVVAVIIVVY